MKRRFCRASSIGEVAAFARQHGDTWFVGIINGGDAKTYPLGLSFLGKGKYRAVTVCDVAGQPAQMTVERMTADKDTSLDVSMETGGGFVAWLVPK